MDELNAPLGQTKKRKSAAGLRARLPFNWQQAVVGVLGLFIAAVAGWALTVDDPLGGEPMVVVAAKPPGAEDTASAPGAAGHPNRYDGPATAAPAGGETAAGGARTVNIIDGASGKSQQVVIPGTAGGDDRQTAGDPRLLETSRHGNIPKIGADGTRPSAAYAQPLRLPPGKSDAPRIAIVVTGLGISSNATNDALTKLPGAVSLAFTPYGSEIGRLTARARSGGHEVLLQAPMEPFDYPDNDPGPQTLLTAQSPDQNIDRLHWLMSRFQGFVGVANYMGARFTASEQALAPVLREIGKRGLIYLDDGSSARSAAGQIAGASGIPFAKAEVVIDAVPTGAEIDRALGRLEAQARERGVAVGVIGALPLSITRVAEWTKRAESRGFVLVPITAVAVKAKSS